MPNVKLEDVLSRLKNVKRSGSGYSARCPAHDDQNPSLGVTEDNGRVGLKCFADKGCSYHDILSAIGISSNGNDHKSGIDAVYDYTDEKGEVLYQIVRFPEKEFRQRHFDPAGQAVWNLKGVRRVPYRLPELVSLAPDHDFVMAEGEKDADTLKEYGLIATNHKNWQPSFNHLLKNRGVVIFQDHDRAGVALAEKAARIVSGDARAVKIVDCFSEEPLPEKHGKDVSDYLETNSFDQLLQLVQNTPNWDPTAAASTTNGTSPEAGLNVVRLADIEAKEITWLWKPYIPIGEFTILEGVEGLGKSWMCCGIARAVANGEALPFNESETMEPGVVLMLSAEDSLSHTVKPRLLSMDADLDNIFAVDDVFSMGDEKDFLRFEAIVAEYEPRLIIIDPMFSYTGGKDLNQESVSRPLARKLIAIAQKYQCAIIGVRHLGKSKGNGDARAAGLGSIAWRASARSSLLVGKDDQSKEIAMVQTKNNLAEKSRIAVGFEIINGRFYWANRPSSLTEERILSHVQNDEAKAEKNEAVEFLREALKDGEKPSDEVLKEGRKNGISEYALRKARAALGIKPVKKGGNFGGNKGWYIGLPEAERRERKAEDLDYNSEEDDFPSNRRLQSNQRRKTSYGNTLAEDVEMLPNGRIQRRQPASSNGLHSNSRGKGICECGAIGFIGGYCPDCGEEIVPL